MRRMGCSRRTRASAWLTVAVLALGCSGGGGGAPAGPSEPVLYDALDGAGLDGTRFTNGLSRREVSGGALALEVSASNMERVSLRGVRADSSVAVRMGTYRVTLLRATVSVQSAAAATRTGSATVAAGLALRYQPAAYRLSFPVGSSKLAVAEVGIEDTGSGLRFFRRVALCTDAACSTTNSAAGVSYDDGVGATPFPTGQAASAGVPYSFVVAVNETTGMFGFGVSGPGLGSDCNAEADASSLGLAQGIQPARDYLDARLRVRAFDAGAGGSDGAIRATFDDVEIATDGFPYGFDDFGAGAIDPLKWGTGEGTMEMTGSGLEVETSVSSSSGIGVSSSLLALPGQIPSTANELAVDVTVVAESSSAPSSSSRFLMSRTLYNDGTPGGVAPDVNKPGSGVGDVTAFMNLSSTGATFMLTKGTTGGTGAGFALTSGGFVPLTPSPAHPLGIGTTHRLRMAWDPASHAVTFQLDDAEPVVVDPTTTADPRIAFAAPYAGPKHVDRSALGATCALAPQGTGSVSTRVRLANLWYR
jgi:hypothetical protein